MVFIATAKGEPIAADDAKNLGIFHQRDLPRKSLLRPRSHYARLLALS